MQPVRLVPVGLSLLALAACGSESKAGDDGSIAVTATDSACKLAKTSLPAGKNVLKVTNQGSKVTELYVYAAGDKIVTERENIGPGTTAELTVQLAAGTYQVACKPGMKGNGIRQTITVTGTAAAGDQRLTQAVAAYRTFVAGQVDDTLATTRTFAESVKKGDIAGAKALFAPSRVGWETIEPVAESFGDIDPKVDTREADLERGQEWTGWHRLEKDLWVKGSVAGDAGLADGLVAELEVLKSRVPTAQLTPTSMANGAKELLDEVATGKITGEEDTFSHTDLVDFKANVDGAKKVYQLLRPVVVEQNAALVTRLDGAFTSVDTLLAKYRKGDGYVSYDTVGDTDRKQLSDVVNALGEPLSKLAGAVAK